MLWKKGGYKSDIFKIFSKKIPYPIFSEVDNQITSINGEKSFCYECTSKDLEQLNQSEVLFMYNSLREFMNSLDESIWVKIYRWNFNKIYLSTNEENLVFPGLTVKKLDQPLCKFFGEVNPFTDIDFFESYLTINSEYWRLVQVEIPASRSYESFLDDYNCDYNVCFRKMSNDIAKKNLQQTRRTQGVTLNTKHQNHEGEAAYEEANDLLHEVLNEGEGVFQASICFVVKSESLESLNLKTDTLLKLLREHGAKVFVETRGLDYFFNHLIFGVRPSKIKSIKIRSSYLANLLPYSNDYLHQKGLEVYARSGYEVYLDLYDNLASNQNWLITGESGEGKSFLAANLMIHFYREGVNIGVFDLGKSLKKVALYLGAVDLSQKFNPLQFRCPHFLKNFISSIIGEGNISKKEMGHLYTLIENELDQNVKTFRCLINNLSRGIEGIQHYFSELWEYFVEEKVSIPKIFYVDVEHMPEGLVAPYLIFAKELSERQEGKVINFYDECWHVFDKCPEIISKNAKTGRKNLIGNIFLTQAIVELSVDYGNVAKAIIGNTYGKIYFHQIDTNHQALSKFERDILGGVKSKKGEYSEFLFSSPDYKKVVKLYASPLIYELCHSEKIENQKQEKFISKYLDILSYKEATDKWVRAIYE